MFKYLNNALNFSGTLPCLFVYFLEKKHLSMIFLSHKNVKFLNNIAICTEQKQIWSFVYRSAGMKETLKKMEADY